MEQCGLQRLDTRLELDQSLAFGRQRLPRPAWLDRLACFAAARSATGVVHQALPKGRRSVWARRQTQEPLHRGVEGEQALEVALQAVVAEVVVRAQRRLRQLEQPVLPLAVLDRAQGGIVGRAEAVSSFGGRLRRVGCH